MALLRTLRNNHLISNVIKDVTLKSCSVLTVSNRYSTTPEYSYEKDPRSTFFHKDVQSLLKTMSRISLEKVYRKRKLGDKKLNLPEYKFMTDDQLNQALKEAQTKADEVLQMPPVMQVRTHIEEVLNKDPALEGLDTSRIVFTDITFGKKNVERLIVVREPDGTLRKADWDVRDRMNQVYFPMKGRELRIPKMFQEEQLKSLLDRKEYEFVLDRACLQFEPNDPEYHRITNATYLHANENEGFELLRSTRHFGPFAFFMAWFKMVDNLLLDLIQTERIDEAKTLVELYGRVHSVSFDLAAEDCIEGFIKGHCNKKAPLELALQAYRDIEKQRRSLEIGIEKAHGRL